jgi:TorA maturation chaperone TorD
MRDPGLSEAIKAAGGVAELARKIGISQPSVSNWSRVPSERVLSVEAVTGVSRQALRPDLYNPAEAAYTVDPVDQARSEEYALLSALLARAPDAHLLRRLGGLQGDSSALGDAHAALAALAREADPREVGREYFALFVGIGRGELVPYGSYYLTGFLNERPLARVRADLARLGLERSDGEVEPEDRVSVLCEVMSGLAGGRYDVPPGTDRQFFEAHLAPWFRQFFIDLEQAESADFYRPVGRLGRIFMEVEAEGFTLDS